VYESDLAGMEECQLERIARGLLMKYGVGGTVDLDAEDQRPPWRMEDAQLMQEIREELGRRGRSHAQLDDLLVPVQDM
jgi:hypothetical protein